MIRRLLPLLLALPSPAAANMFEVFGANARGLSLAGAGAASVRDPSAVWVNPAALHRSGAALSVGLLGGFNRGRILLADRPAGYDPPGYDTRQRPRQDTEDPQRYGGLNLAASFSLLSDRLHFGLALYAPFNGFGHLSTRYVDERAQNFSNDLAWTLTDERLRAEVIAGAMSYNLTPWITFGLGVNVLPRSTLIGHVYTRNAVDPAQVDLNLDVEQGATYGLLAGALIEPTDWLTVGLSFQDEVYFKLTGYNEIELPETGEVVRQPMDLRVHSTPARGTLAAAAVAGAMTFNLDVTYSGWRRFRDSQGQTAGFEDTVDFKAGVELQAGADSRLRAGLGWYDSPIPEQTGRTNYVDTDRLILAVGAGQTVQLMDQTVELDVGLQIHLMRPRQTQKSLATDPACTADATRICDELPDQAEDSALRTAAETQGLQTGNPGWPGYSSGGYLVSVGADARWRF